MCGGLAVVLVEYSGREYSVRVECSACHISTAPIVYAHKQPLFDRDQHAELRRRIALGDARREAAAAWNRRTE